MVRKAGSRVQDSAFRFSLLPSAFWLLASLLLLPLATYHLPLAFSQQPQAQSGQPIYSVNAKYVNGVAPGYWPTASSGLTLNLSAGTAHCGNPPAPVFYPGGTLTMVANATNYVYLDPAASCAPASLPYISSPPSAPSLSQVAGGSLSATTYYVKITYVNAQGETTASAESSLAVSANYLLHIASPASVPGATGWNVYIWTASGGEMQDNNPWNDNSVIPIGTAYTMWTGGFCRWDCNHPPPSWNSTGFAPGEIPIASVVTGSSTITSITDLRGGSNDSNTTQGPVIRADLLPGSNLGQKWANCIAALPPSGGICDLTRLTGAQTITSNPLAGVTKPVTSTFGVAVITTVPIVFPNMFGGMSLRGSGKYAQTVFRASAANQPVFSGPTSGLCDMCYLGYFTVQAHASGSTGPAIETSGFRNTTFEQIAYADNPNWTGAFNSFMHFSAYPAIDYGNQVLFPIIAGNPAGPTNVFLFDTGGSGDPTKTANVNLIEWPVVVQNDHTTTIFNLQRSTQTIVRGGWIEQNSNATILIPGVRTIFEGVLIDTNPGATLLSAQQATDGLSTQVIFRDNWIAGGMWTFTIPSWSSEWLVTGNEPAGSLTVTDNGSNDFIQFGATINKLTASHTIVSGVNTVTFSATPTFDASLGNTQKITLTGNVTSSTLSNAAAGQMLYFDVCQDSTGSRTFVWPSNVNGGMTIGSTASKCNAQSFVFDGTNAYATGPGAANM